MSSNLTVGLKISPHIRSTVLREQSGYMFLGGKIIIFRDRFHFQKQCYHCQQIGHISLYCPKKADNPTYIFIYTVWESIGQLRLLLNKFPINIVVQSVIPQTIHMWQTTINTILHPFTALFRLESECDFLVLQTSAQKT